VPKKTLLLVLAFAIVFDFTGCAMSPQARRKRAYPHYVAKQMKNRTREMARAQKQANRELKRKMKNVRPSELKVTTRVEDVASYSAPASGALPAVEKPAFKEPVVDTITVSASSTIPTDVAPQQRP
jgi:hypothetical protein